MSAVINIISSPLKFVITHPPNASLSYKAIPVPVIVRIKPRVFLKVRASCLSKWLNVVENGLKVGATVLSGKEIDITVGNALYFYCLLVVYGP